MREGATIRLMATGRRHVGNVRKLPSGRWQASYWHDGERHLAPDTFPTKSDAQAFLSTKEIDILRGKWTVPAAGRTTFGEFADRWLDQQGHLRPRTVELYRYLLGSHIRPSFGNRQLAAITNSQVVAWHRALAAKLPATARKAYRLMASIMRAAVHDGCLTRTQVEVKGASKEPTHEEPVATVAEVEALAEVVPEPYRAMVLMAAWCGLRFGERTRSPVPTGATTSSRTWGTGSTCEPAEGLPDARLAWRPSAWEALSTRPAPGRGCQLPLVGGAFKVARWRLAARQTADRRPPPSLAAGDASPSWLGQFDWARLVVRQRR